MCIRDRTHAPRLAPLALTSNLGRPVPPNGVAPTFAVQLGPFGAVVTGRGQIAVRPLDHGLVQGLRAGTRSATSTTSYLAPASAAAGGTSAPRSSPMMPRGYP